MFSKRALGLFSVMGLLVFSMFNAAQAAPVSALVRAEIDGLMSSLQRSSCQFSRNGAWHNAEEAKSHLMRKLSYLEDKNAVQTTEQFIELAASKSSMSNQAYQVKCPNETTENSRDWLLKQLKAQRAGKK